MLASPFVGPRLKITNAKRHLRGLRDTITQFGKETKIDWKWRDLDDDNPDSKHLIEVRFVFSQKPPDDVPLAMGDVVHNLRSALDIMLCDIAHLREVGASGVKFPFAESAEKLDERLDTRELKHLGNDVVEAIRSLAPYKGGHIGLRGLHDLDVADKHKLLLPTYVVAYATMPMLGMMTELFQEHTGINFGFENAVTPVHEGAGMVVDRNYDPKSFFNFPEGGPVPAFGHELPFAGEPVLETLESLSQLTNEIVESFAGKFGSGNANAAPTPSGDNSTV